MSWTKVYLTNKTAGYSPATLRGAWDDTGAVVTRMLDTLKDGGGNITSVARAETNASNTWDVLLYRGVSGPLDAQTISGTVDVVLGVVESNADADFVWHIHIYVTQGDSDTPRGTLLSDYVELVASEWPTTAAGKALASAQALTNIGAITAGDRLVVEIGYRALNSHTTSRTGTLRYGTEVSGEPVADLSAGNTNVTTLAGFLTFSSAIASAATLPMRVSQDGIETLIAGDPTLRDSQDAIEVLYTEITAADHMNVTQEGLEALFTPNPGLDITQDAFEVLIEPDPEGDGEWDPEFDPPPPGVIGFHPRVFVTVGINDTTYGFSFIDLENLLPGNQIITAGKLLHISDLTRELSSDGWRGNSWEFVIADVTREFREKAEEEVMEGSVAKAYIIGDDERWAGLEPFVLTAGEVAHHSPPDDTFRYRFRVEDILSRRFSDKATEARVPAFLMNKAWIATLDDSLDGKAMPVALGRMKTDAGGGMVPGMVFGQLNLTALGGINKDVIALVFHEGAAAKVSDLFFTPATWEADEAVAAGTLIRPTTSNGFHYVATTSGTTGSTEPTFPTTLGGTVNDNGVIWEMNGDDDVRVRVPDDAYSTQLVIAPHKSSEYPTLTGQSGHWVDFGTPPHRFTVVFIDANIPFYSQAILERRITIAMDEFGITEGTDGTGRYYDSPEWTSAWIIRNQILGEWDGITNAPVPSINGEYDAINYDSLLAARAISEVQLPPLGHVSGTLLGRNGIQQSGFDALFEQVTGGFFELGLDRFGRVFFAREDPDAVGVGDFNDVDHFESFISHIDERSNINYLDYMYDFRYISARSAATVVSGQPLPQNPEASKWGSGLLNRKDDPAIAAVKRKKPAKLEMYNIHSSAVAEDLKERYFQQRLGSPTAEGRRAFMCRGPWEILLVNGTAVELNTVLKLSAQRGFGASGYVQKRGRVRKITISPMKGRVQYEGAILRDAEL